MKSSSKIVFFGTPDFARAILAALWEKYEILTVVTQPDKPQGRSGKAVPSPVKEFALEKKIPVLNPEKALDILDDLRELEADFFIVAAYGQILTKAVIDLPKTNILNVHASRLPRYRGASPIQAAILAGDIYTGNSIMEITPGLDAGPVLAQSKVTIDPKENAASLTAKLAEDGGALLLDVLENYEKYPAQAQDEAAATYTRQIKKTDGRLVWSKDAESLSREIRAYNPWPVSFSFIEGLKLNIIQAEVSEKKLEVGLMRIENGRLYVGTKTKALEILEIQPAGKNAMAACQFINGYRQLDNQTLQ